MHIRERKNQSDISLFGTARPRTNSDGLVVSNHFTFFWRFSEDEAFSPAKAPAAHTTHMADPNAPVVKLPDGREVPPATARGGTQVPDHVLRAIYGDSLPAPEPSTPSRPDGDAEQQQDKGEPQRLRLMSKAERYDESLKTWWKEYADRKNDEEEEHVSDSLLYDFTHLPRMTPAPNLAEDRLKHVEPVHGEGKK